MVHFPTREKNTLDLILTTLPGQFQDVHSPDKLSDHDIVSGTFKIFIPPIKKSRRKVYLYQKGDYESMRKDTLEFAKEKYFNGHSDTRSVQENFDLLTSFIQDSADKHIPSKTSRSVSSVPWITPETRRSIRSVSPEPSLLAHTSNESRGTFRQKARSLAPVNGWACAVKICHDGMLEDTDSLDGAQIIYTTGILLPARAIFSPSCNVV